MAKLHTAQTLLRVATLWFLSRLPREVAAGDCGPWSDWTPCSATCGPGLESRTRECTIKAPGYELCKNQPTTETKRCRKENCPVKILFQEVGCFKEVPSDRALPTLVADLKHQVDWGDLKKTVQACAKLAHEAGWQYFGLQDYAICYGGPSSANYSRHGASNDCWQGLGKAENANFVYKLKSAD